MLQAPAGRMDHRNRFPRQNWSYSCSGEVQSGQNLRLSGSDAPVGPRLATRESGPLESCVSVRRAWGRVLYLTG
jgi:hypothetical protein